MDKSGGSDSKKHKLILDTNIFNWVLDNKLQIAEFPADSEFYATHIQFDELERTSDSLRKSKLLETFFRINPSILLTDSFIIGRSRIEKAKISDGSLYIQILDGLNIIKVKDNNVNDSLISEVAIFNKLELVSMDRNLIKVHKQYGGNIYNEFTLKG